MTAPHNAPMPAAFLGHGSPMNALEQNRYTKAWRDFAAAIPRPRGILMISAHWYIGETAVTAMPQPRTLHDFGGFPQELFEVEYPAPGDPVLAEEVSDLVRPTRANLDRDSWGLDHGTWSLLVHAFPKADVPVVQLSIDSRKSLDEHLALGAKLAPLRERGVLILGSGNVVHNLRAMIWTDPQGGFDWTRRFDAAAREALTGKPEAAAGLSSHPDFKKAVPTPDHYIPLLYLAGLAGAAKRPAKVLIEGPAFGSISMTCYTLDAPGML